MKAFSRLACTAIALTVSLSTTAIAGSVKIKRTAYDIPNIQASNWKDAGFGVGYAQAEDNFCLLAAMWTVYAGEAAQHTGRYLGPGRADSDLYNSYINQTVDLEAIINQPPPHGPTPDVLDLLDGYIAGYNRYYNEHYAGRSSFGDLDDCDGSSHLREIDRIDVARRLYELIGKGGRDLVRGGQLLAEPPSLTSVPTIPNSLPLAGRIPVAGDVIDIFNAAVREYVPQEPTTISAENLALLGKAFSDWVSNGGSNGLGFGSEATSTGSGMLLGNPHWTWDGFDRFWQMHVKVQAPGAKEPLAHVSGMGFIGQPLVMIGHNEHVAWTHTVSAARRLALAELTLVPGDPTSYVVGGEVHKMQEVKVTVQVGSGDDATTKSKTFYETIFGPVTTSILGLELLPWTHTTAFAMIDMNTGSARIANQFLESNSAKSVDEHYAAHAKWVGNPWATTTVADSQGNVLWTDVGTVPNISNEHAARCNTALGHALWNSFAVAVLRSADPTCDVPTTTGNNDPHDNSVAPKTMPASLQPVIRRNDYVENSNESHWLTNVYEPLTGYSRVFGPENSQRAMRTRMGHRLFLDRYEAGEKFTRQDVQDLLFSNRNMLAELWADDLVEVCQAHPTLINSNGQPVDVQEACQVIANWDRTFNLDSPGAVLFYRFTGLSLAELDFTTSYAGLPGQPMWRVPFLLNDPVNTPAGLNPAYLPAQRALADAVSEFQAGGLALDTTMRESQISEYGSRRTALHGGEGTFGMFNAMNQRWRTPQNGTPYIGAGRGGPSFVQVTAFQPGADCMVDDRTLLLGSQRSERAWSRADEQQDLYSSYEWVDPPFCDAEVANAPGKTITLGVPASPDTPPGSPAPAP